MSVRSLLNVSAGIRQHARIWLTQVLSYDDGHTIDWTERVPFWKALGADTEMLERFEAVNPRWDAALDTMFATAALRHDPNGFEKVYQLLLYVLSWVKFSDTRFAAIGKCGRRWLLSVAMGLDNLFRQVQADRKVSRYYSNGYLRCKFEVRWWLSTAALAFYPTESMMLDILEDDRFYKRRDELLATLAEEMHYVNDLPLSTFKAVVDAAGLPCTADELRSSVLQSMLISVGFCHKEAFEETNELPIRLTQGNINDNVANVAMQLNEPDEPRTKQLWNCLRQGVHRDFVVRLLQLVKDSPCTTGLSETGRQFVRYGLILMGRVV